MIIIFPLLCVLLTTAGWFAYRRCRRPVFRRLIVCAAVVVGLFVGLGAWGYFGLRKASVIVTSADAQFGEVDFLKLPPSAYDIGFWRDGIIYCAEFNVSEQDFNELFRAFQFDEIA